MDPVTPVKNPDGSYAEGMYNDINNPAARLHYTNDTYANYRTLANIYADIKFMDGLTFKTNYNFEYTFGTSDYYYPKFYVSPVFNNPESIIGKYHDSQFINQWSNTLTYVKSINDAHNFTALIEEDGTETKGTFLLNMDDMTLQIFDAHIPDYDEENCDPDVTATGVYQVKILEDGKLFLWQDQSTLNPDDFDYGWAWVFVPDTGGE